MNLNLKEITVKIWKNKKVKVFNGHLNLGVKIWRKVKVKIWKKNKVNLVNGVLNLTVKI